MISVALLAFALPLVRAALPDFALTYAPYTYLEGSEAYWPSDIATHLQHVTPQRNGTELASSLTLADLSSYDSDVFLTSKDDVTNADQPKNDWLLSNYGKPASGGKSAAPATIIAVQKANNIVDVFYFFFYSWDLGNPFIGIRFGNHVGDWEHQMVRFKSGVPTNVYLSAHSAGTAYTFAALPKASGTQRPITYIAKGTHANYATAGSQKYPVPVIGPISDSTSAGSYWDVTQNYRGYWYDPATNKFTSAGGTGSGGTAQVAGEVTSWLNYRGKWGDDVPANYQGDQYCISTECHYVAGPTGPIDKNLGRTAVCQNESDCLIASSAKTVVVGDVAAQLAQVAKQLQEAEARGLTRNITFA